MKKYVSFVLLAVAVTTMVAVISCDPSTDPAPASSLTVSFDNVVGSQDLKLGTSTYQDAAGESFVVTKFNYYISNIRLRKDDGSEFVVPQDKSYFLIEEERPASQTFTLTNVPTGNYTGITFLIGVDSVRSLSDISLRTGVLDPGVATHDPMYWEWNSGYIFLKLEGTSPSAPAAQNNLFYYHIGGFGGGYNGKKTINNLCTITLPFNGDLAKVAVGTTPSVQVKTDLLKVFNGSTTLSIAGTSTVMFEPYSTNIANNYAQMMRYDRIQANQ